MSEDNETKPALAWNALRFMLHLCAVYLLVQFSASALAGWIYRTLMPAIQAPRTSTSFEFFYNHLLIFSVLPAFATGLLNARFKHKVAEWVWVVPTAVLAYKLATFPIRASVLANSSWPALHHFFGGGFLIPNFHSWGELFQIMFWNPDMKRGADQLRFTAPFYAGVAYSVAATLGSRIVCVRDGLERLRKSEARAIELHAAEVASESTTVNELPQVPPHAPAR